MWYLGPTVHPLNWSSAIAKQNFQPKCLQRVLDANYLSRAFSLDISRQVRLNNLHFLP